MLTMAAASSRRSRRSIVARRMSSPRVTTGVRAQVSEAVTAVSTARRASSDMPRATRAMIVPSCGLFLSYVSPDSDDRSPPIQCRTSLGYVMTTSPRGESPVDAQVDPCNVAARARSKEEERALQVLRGAHVTERDALVELAHELSVLPSRDAAGRQRVDPDPG